MDKPSVVVTFDPRDDSRGVLTEMLGEVSNLAFLTALSGEDRTAALRDAQVLISGAVSRELKPEEYPVLERVRLIQTIPAGADRVPLAGLTSGITVATNAGAFAEPMAEHVIAMTLVLAKNIVCQNEKLRRGEFDQATRGRELAGMTAGIIGFGGIGRATARLMRAFGMRILALNRSGRSDEPAEFVGTLDDLNRVLAESDVVVLSIPLHKRTRGMIGRAQLEQMKPEAILINVARGKLIDQKDLYEHARTHPSFLVGLDVWWGEPFQDGRFHSEYPLLDLPNVIGSPHNSGHVPDMMRCANRRAAENVLRFLRGQPLTGVIRREEYID